MLNDLYKDLSMALGMSEDEACDYFDADSKVEAIAAIEGEIEYYESKIYSDSGSESMIYNLDEAFYSWEQVNSMFI